MLEEDLAVGLMYKLLFVPLFQNVSIFGKVLSFVFRVLRIFIGLIAFVLASTYFALVAIYWFSLPLLIYFNFYTNFNLLIIFFGTTFFVIHYFTHPQKKVWQVYAASSFASGINKLTGDIWLSSRFNKSHIDSKNIINNPRVQLFLLSFECQNFTPDFQIKDLDQLGKDAFELAVKSNSPYIEPEHFFVALVYQQTDVEKALSQLGVEKVDTEEALRYLQKRNDSWRRVFIWDTDFPKRHLKGINREWLGAPTPLLDSVSKDLTREVAMHGSAECIGRSDVYSQMVDVLSHEMYKNVLLVAPSGSGKTALIRHLAKQIVAGNISDELSIKRLVILNFSELLSGLRSDEDVINRIHASLEEAQSVGNVIVVIEEVHKLCLDNDKSDLYSAIKPFLQYGNFQFIATTEPECYTQILKTHSIFSQFFTTINLPVISRDNTMEILESKAVEIERKYRLKVTFVSLKKCLEIGEKNTDKALPASAIIVLNKAINGSEEKWIDVKAIERLV